MQQVIKGEGSIKQSGNIIAEAGHQKVFLITGKHFSQERYPGFLKGLDTFHYVKQGVNVEEAEIEVALLQFKQSQSTVILAIGGGSVIDIGKAIIYKLKIKPFFIAAPTTAGSGSEATCFAVVYKGKKKESLVHPNLLPEVVFLDPELTYSLPSYQTATSGMDALSQAVESFWNKNANSESKQYSAEAIIVWKENFLKAVLTDDHEAKERLLYAAHMAGKAINITRTTGPHALSYYLTSRFNVPHGQAVSLFLPAFFLYNPDESDLYELLGVRDGEAAADLIRQYMKQAGLATTLEELGIKKGDVMSELLSEVNEERFANNPSPLDEAKLRNLLSEQI